MSSDWSKVSFAALVSPTRASLQHSGALNNNRRALQVSKQLLAIPWAAFPLDDDNDDNPSNVLVKVLGPASDLEVVLFCSDLRGCWLEVLTRRKLVRRVRQALQDAGAEQSQTLSSGHGEDEELLLRKTVDEVLAALRGIVTAELTLEKSSYTVSRNGVVISHSPFRGPAVSLTSCCCHATT